MKNIQNALVAWFLRLKNSPYCSKVRGMCTARAEKSI